MGIRTVEITKLSPPIRQFLSRVGKGNGLLVEDAKGRARYGVIRYDETTPAEKKKAWQDIEKLQQKVGKAMKRHGITEDDVERLLLEDD